MHRNVLAKHMPYKLYQKSKNEKKNKKLQNFSLNKCFTLNVFIQKFFSTINDEDCLTFCIFVGYSVSTQLSHITCYAYTLR